MGVEVAVSSARNSPRDGAARGLTGGLFAQACSTPAKSGAKSGRAAAADATAGVSACSNTRVRRSDVHEFEVEWRGAAPVMGVRHGSVPFAPQSSGWSPARKAAGIAFVPWLTGLTFLLCRNAFERTYP